MTNWFRRIFRRRGLSREKKARKELEKELERCKRLMVDAYCEQQVPESEEGEKPQPTASLASSGDYYIAGPELDDEIDGKVQLMERYLLDCLVMVIPPPTYPEKDEPPEVEDEQAKKRRDWMEVTERTRRRNERIKRTN